MKRQRLTQQSSTLVDLVFLKLQNLGRRFLLLASRASKKLTDWHKKTLHALNCRVETTYRKKYGKWAAIQSGCVCGYERMPPAELIGNSFMPSVSTNQATSTGPAKTTPGAGKPSAEVGEVGKPLKTPSKTSVTTSKLGTSTKGLQHSPRYPTNTATTLKTPKASVENGSRQFNES